MAMLQRTFDVTIMSPPKEWTTGLVSGARPHFSNDVGREQHGIESGTVQILADAMKQAASRRARDSMLVDAPREPPVPEQLNGGCGLQWTDRRQTVGGRCC
jgi:hypothetical protein